jgi:polyisoprenoid-binding protein YceI
MNAFRRALKGGLCMALVMSGISLSAAAQEAQTPTPALTGTITISGSSTVRGWSCRTTEVAVAAAMAPEYTEQILTGENPVLELTATIAVSKIGCGNGTMEGHLRKALKANENPDITFRLKDYAISPRDSQSVSVVATGDLTIAGTTQSVEVPVSVTALPDGGLRIEGEKKMRMTEFGVKPPKLMLGTLKVHDDIRIVIDVTIQPAK